MLHAHADDLALGFSVALSASNLCLCLLGCLIGTLIGVLPGIGPIATISILLPFTFGISPVGSMIMLAGIYYGAQYGGSTTAILVRMPGEASSIVTIHRRTRDGRATAGPVRPWRWRRSHRSSPAPSRPSSSAPSRRRSARSLSCSGRRTTSR